ncbi:MAG: hypothetical protein AABY18_08785 [Candidatus Thermoplasmatota archaeon]
MVRNRVLPRILYGTLGLVVVGAASVYAFRSLRRASDSPDEASMLTLRRSTRSVGRAVKGSAQKVGKALARSVEDTGDALVEAGREFEFDSGTAPKSNRI